MIEGINGSLYKLYISVVYSWNIFAVLFVFLRGTSHCFLRWGRSVSRDLGSNSLAVFVEQEARHFVFSVFVFNHHHPQPHAFNLSMIRELSRLTLMKFYCLDVCKISSIPQEFSIFLHHRQFIQSISHAVLIRAPAVLARNPAVFRLLELTGVSLPLKFASYEC